MTEPVIAEQLTIDEELDDFDKFMRREREANLRDLEAARDEAAAVHSLEEQ